MQLFLTTEMGNLFLGGLLAVARADGVVVRREMDSLRSTASELGLAIPAEEDLLLAEEVTPETFAAAITSGAGAYRSGGSSPGEIAHAFLDTALRLALADGELVFEEIMALREFASVLAVPTDGIPGWRAISAELDG